AALLRPCASALAKASPWPWKESERRIGDLSFINRRTEGCCGLSIGLSAQEEADEALGERAVRWAKKFERADTRLQQDPFLLGESCEACAAVVMAHTAGANSAKRQMVLRDVENDVVHGDAA